MVYVPKKKTKIVDFLSAFLRTFFEWINFFDYFFYSIYFFNTLFLSDFSFLTAF